MKPVFRFVCVLLAVSASTVLTGCIQPIEAISVSNTSLDFGLNTRPLFFDVWNNNPDADPIRIQVRPNRPWVLTDVSTVLSAPPGTASGPFDKQAVRVTIDRNQLNRGVHEAEIELRADGVVSKTISIRVESDRDNNDAPLNIINPETKYRSPFLIEFSYALRDANGEAVVAEPAQFDLTAREGDKPATFETGLHLRRAAARQLKAELLLDYSLTLQAVPQAIAAMEDAAKNVFLPALNSDALVGLTEFHAETPGGINRVAEFTTDRAFLRDGIDSIQGEFVQGFASFARIFDAIIQVAQQFDEGDAEKEDRYIVLFTDGNDTSSTNTANAAVTACKNRNIKIYTVGVGANVDEATLIDLSTRTNGLYFPSDTAADLSNAFERVVNDLEAQYTVRWASGQRGAEAEFFPQFSLSLGDASTTFLATTKYRARDVVGDPLGGQLFFVASDNTRESTVFLRAQYVPRNITRLRLTISSDLNFTVAKVETGQDGLVGDWTMDIAPAKARSVIIDLRSPDGTPLPFATFGPLLRLDFSEVFDRTTLPFTSVTVDNSFYPNNQFFEVEGFETE